MQGAVAVRDDDTPGTLETRILAIEHLSLIHIFIGIGLPNNHDTITAVTIMMSRETTRMTIQRGTAPQIPSAT